MQVMYLGMAFTAGTLLALQAAVNSQLGKSLNGQPMMAALVSFLIGSVALFIMTVARGQFGSIALMPQQEWWKWTGGLMGAFLVCSSIIVAPKVGVANMLLFIILGQLLSGLLIDHYGFLGMPIKHVDWSKILGVGIVLIGMVVFFFGHKVVKS